MEFENAISNGVGRLYHYSKFDRVRLSNVVIGKKLYFSRPNEFNDPWDCKPYYRTDNLDEPGVFENHLRYYVSNTHRHQPELLLPEIFRRAQSFRDNRDLYKQKVKELTEAMTREIAKQYRVFCLSRNPSSELMWAHYGLSHSGLCLEFEVRNQMFAAALKVQYGDDYPQYEVTSDEETLMPLLSKSSSWKYEDEYRLFALNSDYADIDTPLIAHEGFVDLGFGVLKSVTMGCMFAEDDVEDLKNIILQAEYPITLRQATKSDRKYEILIEVAD